MSIEVESDVFNLSSILTNLPAFPEKWEKDEDKPVTDAVEAIYYKDNEWQDDHMDRRKQHEAIDDKELETNWRDISNIGMYAEDVKTFWPCLLKFLMYRTGNLENLHRDTGHESEPTRCEPSQNCSKLRWTKTSKIRED